MNTKTETVKTKTKAVQSKEPAKKPNARKKSAGVVQAVEKSAQAAKRAVQATEKAAKKATKKVIQAVEKTAKTAVKKTVKAVTERAGKNTAGKSAPKSAQSARKNSGKKTAAAQPVVKKSAVKTGKKNAKSVTKKSAVKKSAGAKKAAAKTQVKESEFITPVSAFLSEFTIKSADKPAAEKTQTPEPEAVRTSSVLPEIQPRRIAIVVGASSGIGYHTAVGLTKEGYKVYNLSRTESEPFHIHNIKADAENGDEIGRAVQKVFDLEGRIDVLVYSAGWSLAAPLEHVTEEDFRKVFEVNYFGLIKALWAVIPFMRQSRSGRIVAVSSMAGTMPVAFDAPYSAAKAALDITLRALAIELKPFNIKLTSVQPGGVSTHFTFKRKVYPAEQIGEYAESMQKAVVKLAEMEQSGMDPKAVADSIVTLLSWTNPPETTAVGLQNKAARFAYKILPGALADLFNRLSYDQ